MWCYRTSLLSEPQKERERITKSPFKYLRSCSFLLLGHGPALNISTDASTNGDLQEMANKAKNTISGGDPGSFWNIKPSVSLEEDPSPL